MTANGKSARAERRDDVRLYGPPDAESLYLDIDEAWEVTDADVLEEHTVRPTTDHLPSVDALLEWVCEWAAENGELDEYGSDAIDNAAIGEDVEAAVRGLYNTIASKVTYRMAADVVAVHHRLRPSTEWLEVTNVRLMDPDGWDRKNLAESMAEPITRAEFVQRVMASTVLSTGTLRELAPAATAPNGRTGHGS